MDREYVFSPLPAFWKCDKTLLIVMFDEEIIVFVSLSEAQILKIMSVIYRLVQSNSYATKRLAILHALFAYSN